MICTKCNNERCICEDLKERLEEIKRCEHIHIGLDYMKRIEKQAERNKKHDK